MNRLDAQASRYPRSSGTGGHSVAERYLRMSRVRAKVPDEGFIDAYRVGR